MPFHTNTLDTQTLWHNKACTKYFPALLHTTQLADGARGGKRGSRGGARRGCERWLREAPSTSTTFTSKPARSTSQYYFVPQSLQNVFSSTTYFVLQSLDKALPSTTLYACTKYFALQSLHKVLCTTKLAQCTSQYYFVLLTQITSQYFVLQSLKRAVLQSLHKVLPTWHYKVSESNCIYTSYYFPVLLVLQSMQRELSCCACEPFARIQLNLMLCLRNVPRDKKTRKKT